MVAHLSPVYTFRDTSSSPEMLFLGQTELEGIRQSNSVSPIVWEAEERGELALYALYLERLLELFQREVDDVYPVLACRAIVHEPAFYFFEGASTPIAISSQVAAPDIVREILTIAEATREQTFEDGMESDFSKALTSVLALYGNAAVRALSDLILNKKIDAEVASEALRWLGQMDDRQTHDERLRVVEQSLGCLSARVRDGASLALSFLDDPHAVPYLQEAIDREANPELREDMIQVLEQLEHPE